MISQKTKILGAGILAGLILGASPFVLKIEAKKNSAEAASSFSDAQKEELNGIIKEFILNNPTVLLDSVNNHQQNQAKAQEEQGTKALAEVKDTLTKNADFPSAGASMKDADITIVEFFDYNCGYCKRGYESVKSVLNSDKKVRFVFAELPILSPESHTAAQYALAANLQGKYWAYHSAMITFNGPKTKENILKVAGEAGLDTARLEKDASSPKVQEQLGKFGEIAGKLAISGTPAFIIGDQIIRGFIPPEAMQTMIKETRKKKG